MRLRVAILAASAPLLLAADDLPTPLPGWIAGCWIELRGDSWFEECWNAPRAGIMIGSGRTGTGDALHSWESMQIMLDPKIPDGSPVPMAFFGAPGGAGRTMFVLEAETINGLSFTNPAHDYPQRVRYWREGENLLAEVSLLDGANAMRWTYRRAGVAE